MCFGCRVLLGPLGPMVRGRALGPGFLGRACLLPPNGFGCQPQRHLWIPMGPIGRMGNMSLGEVPLPWDHGTGGLLGQKERMEGLPLGTTHRTKSLHVGYPRRRIIPTTSQLGDFCVMDNTCHLEGPQSSFFQTCATGIPTTAQP